MGYRRKSSLRASCRVRVSLVPTARILSPNGSGCEQLLCYSGKLCAALDVSGYYSVREANLRAARNRHSSQKKLCQNHGFELITRHSRDRANLKDIEECSKADNRTRRNKNQELRKIGAYTGKAGGRFTCTNCSQAVTELGIAK